MEASFWHSKWEHGDIGFHENETNPLLVKHLEKLRIQPQGRIFLPLCGKTRDIGWLLGRGHRVVGAELSALAIEQLFSELGLQPAICATGELIRYSASDIDVLVGDFFTVTVDSLGPVDAIYDRAALVALPDGVSADYAVHLMRLTGAAPQLLVSLAYDQQRMAGPPFSVTEDEIRKHYDNAYQVRRVQTNAVAGGLKGKVEATESAWILQNTGRRT